MSSSLLRAASSGGGAAIGSPVSGASASGILYVDASGNLAESSAVANEVWYSNSSEVPSQNPNLTFDGSNLAINGGSGSSYGITMSPMGGYGGAWIDLTTSGASGIGNGGVGNNAWLAYVNSSAQWFLDSNAGDLAYRNQYGNRLLFGINDVTGSGISNSVMQISTGGMKINGFAAIGSSSLENANRYGIGVWVEGPDSAGQILGQYGSANGGWGSNIFAATTQDSENTTGADPTGLVFKAIKVAGPYDWEVVPAITGTQFNVGGLPIYFTDIDSGGNLLQQDVYISGDLTADTITLNNKIHNWYSQVYTIMGVDDTTPSNPVTPYAWIHGRFGGLNGSPDGWIPIYN